VTKIALVLVLSAALIGSAAFAQDRRTHEETIEARLERLEQAVDRLDRKLSSGHGSSMMMEGCPMMDEMMGSRGKHKHRSPNSQWQESPAK
jgi:hypothetical protein